MNPILKRLRRLSEKGSDNHLVLASISATSLMHIIWMMPINTTNAIKAHKPKEGIFMFFSLLYNKHGFCQL